MRPSRRPLFFPRPPKCNGSECNPDMLVSFLASRESLLKQRRRFVDPGADSLWAFRCLFTVEIKLSPWMIVGIKARFPAAVTILALWDRRIGDLFICAAAPLSFWANTRASTAPYLLRTSSDVSREAAGVGRRRLPSHSDRCNFRRPTVNYARAPDRGNPTVAEGND